MQSCECHTQLTLFQQEKTSWFRAKRICIKYNQELLEIHDEKEDAAVEELLSRLDTPGEVWLGGENHADQVSCCGSSQQSGEGLFRFRISGCGPVCPV